MRISDKGGICLFLFLATSVLAGGPLPVHAFDQRDPVRKDSSPWDLFKFGFSAYKKGSKDKAVEAYRYAAEKGHAGALWKLGRMYAEGDGIGRDEYQAYRIFEKVITAGAEPGSRDETYISDALLGLAGYIKRGIPDSPIVPNLRVARELYFQAASMYGNPRAQYEVGRMMLTGEGGSANTRQAVRWLRLSARKGDVRAQALLGQVLFQDGQVVRGLALLTAALDRASEDDAAWIRSMHEEAFAISEESDRRTAVALSQDILAQGLR